MLSAAGEGGHCRWRAFSRTPVPTFNGPNVTSQRAARWLLEQEGHGCGSHLVSLAVGVRVETVQSEDALVTEDTQECLFCLLEGCCEVDLCSRLLLIKR